MKAVILAGGKGTRLAPYTTVFPKPLMPLGQKPILEIIIRQLHKYGFDDIILSVGYLAELIQAYFHSGNNLPEGLNLSYIKEDKPLGTAGSLSLIKDLDENFLVMNGDVLTTLNYSTLFDFHKNNKGSVTIAMHQRQVKIDFGVIQLNPSSEVIGYDEKPSLDYLVSMGVYIFSPAALKYIKPNTYLDFPDLILTLINNEHKVQGFITDEYWLDIGRHEDYEEASKNIENVQKLFL